MSVFTEQHVLMHNSADTQVSVKTSLRPLVPLGIKRNNKVLICLQPRSLSPSCLLTGNWLNRHARNFTVLHYSSCEVLCWYSLFKSLRKPWLSCIMGNVGSSVFGAWCKVSSSAASGLLLQVFYPRASARLNCRSNPWRLNSGQLDSLQWHHDISCIYSVASGYTGWLSGFQDSHHQPDELIHDPLKTE